jgi:hypothetical protein
MKTIMQIIFMLTLGVGVSVSAADQEPAPARAQWFTYADNFEDEPVGVAPSHWLERFARTPDPAGDRIAPQQRWRIAADEGNRFYASDGKAGESLTWLHVFCRDGSFSGRMRVGGDAGVVSILGRMNSPFALVRCDYDVAAGVWTLRQRREKALADAGGYKGMLAHANAERAGTTAEARDLAKAEERLADGWHGFTFTFANDYASLAIDGKQTLAAKTTHLTYGRFGICADGPVLSVDDIAYRGREGRVQDGVRQFDSHDDLGWPAGQGVTARVAGGPLVMKLGGLWLRSGDGVAWTSFAATAPEEQAPWDQLLPLPGGGLLTALLSGPDWRAAKHPGLSTDQGRTWTALADVRGGGTGKAMSCSPNECVVMPDKLTIPRDGRVLFSHYSAPDRKKVVKGMAFRIGTDPNRVLRSNGRDLVTTASRDGGKTWSKFLRVPETDGRHIYQEHDVVELSDGRLRITARSTEGHLFFRESRDDGRTWGPWTPFRQLVSPMCSFQIRTDPEDPKTHYAFWCYNDPKHETDTDDGVDWVMPRTRMSLACSRDDMASWEFLCDVDDWDFPADRFPTHDARYMNHAMLVDRDAVYLITRRANPYNDRGDKPFKHTEETKNVCSSALVTRIAKRALTPYPSWPPLHYANKGIIPALESGGKQ